MSGRAAVLDRAGRMVVGLLAASLAASAAAHLLFTANEIATLPPVNWSFLISFIHQMIFLAGIICVAAMLPAIFFLALAALLKLKHWVWYSGFGAAVPLVVLAALGSSPKDLGPDQAIVWYAVIAGAVGGFVYWHIAVRSLALRQADSA